MLFGTQYFDVYDVMAISLISPHKPSFFQNSMTNHSLLKKKKRDSKPLLMASFLHKNIPRKRLSSGDRKAP
jgi:hypothetical protein